MKLYEYILFENKAEYLLNQYGDKVEQALKNDRLADQSMSPADVINQMQAQVGNKYLQWAVRQYVKQDFRLEDLSRVKRAIGGFNQKKAGLEIKDINQYQRLSDLEDAVEDTAEVKSNRQQKQEIKTEGADVVVKGKDGVVLRLKTKEAACYYGKGTKWCTAADNGNMFGRYNIEGPLYVFLGNDGRKFQFHFETNQFMDEQDRRIDVMDLRKKYSTMDAFLNEMEPTFAKDPELAYIYARHVIKGRFPEAESTIAKDPYEAIYYAKAVIKGRWPEAEPAIAKEPQTAYVYAKDVIKGRWPEVEPLLAKDSYWAQLYASNVIEGPWPEAGIK